MCITKPGGGRSETAAGDPQERTKISRDAPARRKAVTAWFAEQSTWSIIRLCARRNQPATTAGQRREQQQIASPAAPAPDGRAAGDCHAGGFEVGCGDQRPCRVAHGHGSAFVAARALPLGPLVQPHPRGCSSSSRARAFFCTRSPKCPPSITRAAEGPGRPKGSRTCAMSAAD